jgi:5'-3' exonuclease
MALTLLIDSSSMLYRAYFSVPDTVRTDDGTPVNGAYGFINMVGRLIADLRPARLACALDIDWRPQWRVELIESYKAHRVAEAGPGGAPQPDENIEWQIEVAAELLDLAGVAVIGSKEYEAEDVIGALLPRTRGDVAIVSGDRDLFQLVRDPRVWVLYPRRGVSDLIRVDEAEITRRYGIPGRAYADFAILRGDPSDGLPGVRGIGDKSAALLISKHGSLDAVVRAARGATSGPLAKVAASVDYIERAKRVVRIGAEAPVGEVDLTLPRHEPARTLKRKADALRLDGPVSRLIAAIAGR